MTPEQYARLPQYAQRRIKRLEADVAYWQEKARTVVEGETNVYLWEGMENAPLPKDSIVRFTIGERSDAYIDVKPYGVHEGDIRISSGRGFAVQPEASNVITLRLLDR